MTADEILRAELASAALEAFARRLDALGATDAQKEEALSFLRAKLEANAAAWHAGTASANRTVN